MGGVEAVPEEWHGRPWSLLVTVPPLAAVLLASAGPDASGDEAGA
jgi:hypothetical protein